MEEAVLFERSLDDVKGMISHAKLNESDLLPLSQIVRNNCHNYFEDEIKSIKSACHHATVPNKI